MRPILITDPGDPQIAAFREVRERDLVGRQGRFVAEGEVVLRALLSDASRHEAEAVLIAESRWPRLADALEASRAPVFTAGQDVMDAVAGFHIHRGILAMGRRAEPLAAADMLAEPDRDDIALAVVGVGNHDNMGGLFRAAAAFGAAAVLLDDHCCDPFYRKAIRVSVGAVLRTPMSRGGEADEIVARLKSAGFRALAMTPGSPVPLHRAPTGGRVAIVLGAEGPGLPNHVLAACETVGIPMSGGFDSLNVATAGAIALHHFTRQA